MTIDFSPVREGKIKLGDLSRSVTIEDCRVASDASIDHLLELIAPLRDSDVIFDPSDPKANDPYAVEGEEEIGWSVAHLIAHVTASSEEGAAFTSIMGRGVEVDGRLRYETPWKEITTQAQCVSRLEESRRIRNAYLETLPAQPNLELTRKLPEQFEARVGKLNAIGCFLLGLSHELGHYQQISETISQAKNAK
ncbi:MAG: DinB family protein [Chloroflexota bacterium]